METRKITQVKIYTLKMNPMTGKAETVRPVSSAYEKQKLIDLYNSSNAPERYVDNEKWHKSFKNGTPLEWFNPIINPDEDFKPDWRGIGIHEVWIDKKTFDHALKYGQVEFFIP